MCIGTQLAKLGTQARPGARTVAVSWPLARPCRSYSAAHPCALPACRARLPRILRTPAARSAHACAPLSPAPVLPLTPARPLAPVPSAPASVPARPECSLAQPTAPPVPYRGRPAGHIAGPSAMSQRAPGRIVGGDARQACAQPAQLHNTSFLYCSMISNLLHQIFFFFHDKYIYFSLIPGV